MKVFFENFFQGEILMMQTARQPIFLAALCWSGTSQGWYKCSPGAQSPLFSGSSLTKESYFSYTLRYPDFTLPTLLLCLLSGYLQCVVGRGSGLASITNCLRCGRKIQFQVPLLQYNWRNLPSAAMPVHPTCGNSTDAITLQQSRGSIVRALGWIPTLPSRPTRPRAISGFWVSSSKKGPWYLPGRVIVWTIYDKVCKKSAQLVVGLWGGWYLLLGFVCFVAFSLRDII